MLVFTHPDTAAPPPDEAALQAADDALSDWLAAAWSSPAWRAERLLGGGGPGPPDEQSLLARIRDAEALLTQLQAVQAEDLQRLRDRRCAEQQAAHGRQAPAAWVDPDGWVPSQVGFALGLSEAQVRRRLDVGAGLRRYRQVADLVAQGAVAGWTAQKLVEHLDALAVLVSPARLAAIEASVVAWLSARPRTIGALNQRMRRLLLQVRGESGRQSEDAVSTAHADRRVHVATRGAGCAELWALLPEVDALAVAAALDRAAPPSGLVADSEVRTRAQRRADVLVAALTGSPAVDGSAHDVAMPTSGSRAVLEVAVPLSTRRGRGTHPATPRAGRSARSRRGTWPPSPPPRRRWSCTTG